MAEVTAEVLARLSRPDRVESLLGTLEFTDGAPASWRINEIEPQS